MATVTSMFIYGQLKHNLKTRNPQPFTDPSSQHSTHTKETMSEHWGNGNSLSENFQVLQVWPKSNFNGSVYNTFILQSCVSLFPFFFHFVFLLSFSFFFLLITSEKKNEAASLVLLLLKHNGRCK